MSRLTRIPRSRRIGENLGVNKQLRRSLDTFAASVVRMPGVDPITTELVRLRCARHHDCGT